MIGIKKAQTALADVRRGMSTTAVIAVVAFVLGLVAVALSSLSLVRG